MISRVTIWTGARLHFGLLAHRPQVGRQFGGVGLMIDSPSVSISAELAPCDEIAGCPGAAARVREILTRFRQHTANTLKQVPIRVMIHQSIPSHQGLGSGTQLALAVGKALFRLAGNEALSVKHLAESVGRGARSALGLHGFEQGGFLIDGGKRHSEDLGILVARCDFPAAWRVVLVTPPETIGLFGRDEQQAFRELAGMPESLTNRLCRLVLMELLPAVIEQDFDSVSSAIYEYGQQVGAYFATVQGGRLACPRMTKLAQQLRNFGIQGVGQSSWGPTLFVLQPDQASAEKLVQTLHTDSPWSDCQFHIAAPLNRGASIQWEG